MLRQANLLARTEEKQSEKQSRNMGTVPTCHTGNSAHLPHDGFEMPSKYGNK